MKVEEIIRTEFAACESTSAEWEAMDATARYTRDRVAHWDHLARWMNRHKGLGGAYQRRLAGLYRHLVPKGKRVLEIIS